MRFCSFLHTFSDTRLIIPTSNLEGIHFGQFLIFEFKFQRNHYLILFSSQTVKHSPITPLTNPTHFLSSEEIFKNPFLKNRGNCQRPHTPHIPLSTCYIYLCSSMNFLPSRQLSYRLRSNVVSKVQKELK